MVLILPVELKDGYGASEGTNNEWTVLCEKSGRTSVSKDLPAESSPLYAETLIILSLIAQQGSAKIALPPDKPGFVLQMMQVPQIIIDRDKIGEEGMAFLDPILRRELLPPMRDLVNNLDSYFLEPIENANPPLETILFSTDNTLPPNWRTLEQYLDSW